MMFKIPKQEYTAEFKELAVKRVKSGHLPEGRPDKVPKTCPQSGRA